MAQYNDTLHLMSWQVEQVKPSSTPNLRAAWINAAIREALDERPYWAGTLVRTTLRIPGAYAAGSVALTEGSAEISGTDTAWPVADLVNTTLVTAVRNVGWNVVPAARMANITPDTLLYVGGPNPEVVAVTETSPTHFRARFSFPHDAGAPLTCSSLAGRQFRFAASSPIYTLRAVTSEAGGLLDTPWAGATASGLGYRLVKMYVTIAPDVKAILKVIDPSQPDDLTLNAPREYVDAIDPQRSTVGDPQMLVDFVANECGNMQWEIWPTPSAAKHIYVLYARQWPELKAPDDKPPHFINPQVFVDGAISRALRLKLHDDDRYIDPRAADFHELKFQRGKQSAASADNSKAQQALTWMYDQIRGRGSDYRQNHDFSINEGW